MSRVRFWTILIGSEPTSFRANDQDTLLPTLKQLQRVHPQAALRWFEGGRLWSSPDEARRAILEATRPARKRGDDWRPGGEHRDPRARYEVPRDVKRRRFAQRLRRQDARTPQQDEAPRGPAKPTRPRRTSPRPDATRGSGYKLQRKPRRNR